MKKRSFYLALGWKERGLCLLIFCLYICLGMCLSGQLWTNDNIYFGADNGRAFHELIEITGPLTTHYRIVVHPLILVLIQPISLLLDGIIHNPQKTVVVVESLAGTFVSMNVYFIVKELTVNNTSAYIATMLYATSFSTILFTTIPETFIISAVILSSYWRYIVHIFKRGYTTSNTWYILIFWGIACFGSTITNYGQWFIGTLMLIFFTERRKRIEKFLALNIVTGLLAILIAWFQHIAYHRKAPFFLSYYLNICSDNFEETAYISFVYSLDKVKLWLKQILLRPLIGGKNIWQDSMMLGDYNYRPISFGAYQWSEKLLLLSFLILCTICIILAITKTASLKMSRILFATLVYNYLLHFFYGYAEGFIYSQHFLFLFFILIGIGLGELEGVVRIKVSIIFILYGAYQLLENLITYWRMIDMVKRFVENPGYNILHIIFRCIFLVLLLGVFTLRFFMFYKKSKSAKTEWVYEKTILLLIYNYVFLSFLSVLFVMLNTKSYYD